MPSKRERARHCRPTLIWCNKWHSHAFSIFCCLLSNSRLQLQQSEVLLRVDQGLGPKNTGTGRKLVAVCAPHHCHFELVCGPLRSQANEPAKSQITCFSAQTGGLQESINLRLEGVCACGLWHNSTSALQDRKLQFFTFVSSGSICRICSWGIMLYPAWFYFPLEF